MGKIINPVDTHDWYFIPVAMNAVCNRCGIQLMPAFHGLNPKAAEPCPTAGRALLSSVPSERET